MDSKNDENVETNKSTPDLAQAPVTLPAAPQINSEAATPVIKKSSGKKTGKIVLLVLLVLLIPLAAYGGYSASKQSADKKTAKLNSQIALLSSSIHELPAGAIKVSDCIPNMGAHYLTKTSDPEYGPFMLVNKKGKVIGAEYMVSKDMYSPIPQTDPPVEVVTKGSSMYGWKYDHAEVSHLPKGHEGLLEDHVDIHLYTVTSDQQKQACI